MVEILVSGCQAAAVVFLAYGAYLCVFHAVPSRATDFDIGFRPSLAA